MRDKMGDPQRLAHIKEAIAEIENYIRGIDLAEFKNNSMIRFASIKQIEIIGEAAKNLTEEAKEKYKEVEWRQIAGLRNILVHEYFGIDPDLIWQIITKDIPDLKVRLDEIN